MFTRWLELGKQRPGSLKAFIFILPHDLASEPQHRRVKSLIPPQSHVDDGVFDELIGGNLMVDRKYVNPRTDIELFCTGFWLMYQVRFAGGRVASELQLRLRLSPRLYLKLNLLILSAPII